MKTTVPDYPRGVTFEQVWAALQDLTEQQKKRDEEWERIRQEQERAKQEREEERERTRLEQERIRQEQELEQKKAKQEREEERERIRLEQERIRQEQERAKQEREEERERTRLEQERIRQEQELEQKKAKQERDEEWEKSKREWDKSFGHLNNRFGELAEHLVAPGINKRFNELGYHFDEQAEGNYKVWGDDGKIKAEIDLLLQNDDTVMVVEVKSKPDEEDISDHIKRMEILCDRRRRKNDLRKIEGAIAGAIFGAAVKKAVIKSGLYVIEQTGDTMKIDVPDGFVPRKW